MITKTWLITGCSSGFGREIALAALERGDKVAVTARNTNSVADIVTQYPNTAIALSLDVTDKAQVTQAVAQTCAILGSIDVLVNNAGYGYVAAIEEGEEDAVRALFETNFWGALTLTKAVIPHMRDNGGGTILNNSSQAGLMSNPGTGYYSASKYALEGLMEALGKEVTGQNIRVCSVQPGAFRTDWAGRSMQRSAIALEPYAEVAARMDMIAQMDGKQPGDPKRAAQVFLDLADHPNPPPQLLLGQGVLTTYKEKLQAIEQQLGEWQETTEGVDFKLGE